MKNHIKGFGQFINERAKGDYFQVKGAKQEDPNMYGLHQGGSTDWLGPDSSRGEWATRMFTKPDEELSAEEFLTGYGEELGQGGREYLQRESTPESRVKIWKNRSRQKSDILSNLDKMPDRVLDRLHARLSSAASKIGKTRLDSATKSKVESSLSAVEKEMMRRKA